MIKIYKCMISMVARELVILTSITVRVLIIVIEISACDSSFYLLVVASSYEITFYGFLGSVDWC